MKKTRLKKFSIGYNGDKNIIKKLDSLVDYVDSIYFALPLDSPIKSGRRIDVDLKNLEILVNSAVEKNIKSILLLNSPHFLEVGTLKQLLSYIDKTIVPLIKTLNISDVITNNSIIGENLKQKFGNDLLLGTSTLNNIYLNNQIENFKNKGFDYFTLGRELARDRELMKNLSKKYKLKLMINESCIQFCEYQSQHIFYTSFGIGEIERLLPCRRCTIDTFFTSNWLLPRWLKYFDSYIYRYKLVTRNMSSEKLVKTVQSYANGSEVDNFFDIIASGTKLIASKRWDKLDTKLIPDEIFKKNGNPLMNEFIKKTIKEIDRFNK